MDSKWLFLSNPDSSSSSLASFPQCRRPSRIKKIAEEKKYRKRNSSRKRKTRKTSDYFLKYFESGTLSQLKTIYLHCIALNPKWTESCQNQPSSIILPFKCFLSRIVIALEAKTLSLPANPIAVDWISEIKNFAFVFKIVGRQHDKDRSSFYWYWLPHWIFFGSKSVGKEEKNDTRVKCLNRAVLGNIVVFTFYI